MNKSSAGPHYIIDIPRVTHTAIIFSLTFISIVFNLIRLLCVRLVNLLSAELVFEGKAYDIKTGRPKLRTVPPKATPMREILNLAD